jgi:class 3 adenylate cyclase
LSDLPGGTVTMLFSDIEGSTRLLEQLGDRYEAVHKDHRRILRDQLQGAGGREIDTQGDAFFFSFTRARDAVRGAVAAQRALAAHEWTDGAEVKVRMGLHTGEPTVGDEGYLGMDVVRAARICSAGHGGQVLLSETTRALIGNEVPEGVEIRDLGSTQLKDVQHERIFLLALDGQPGDPRPLKTAKSELDSAGDALGKEIERMVHEDILASFRGTSEDMRASFRGKSDAPAKVTRLALIGVTILVVLVAVAVALFLVVRAAF